MRIGIDIFNFNRKVDFIEGENLAIKYKCLFFEISAKSEQNLQKMLYYSVAELPFFEAFKTERIADLVGELEIENNETKGNMSSMADSSRNEINIKDNRSVSEKDKSINIKKSQCKC